MACRTNGQSPNFKADASLDVTGTRSATFLNVYIVYRLYHALLALTALHNFQMCNAMLYKQMIHACLMLKKYETWHTSVCNQ